MAEKQAAKTGKAPAKTAKAPAKTAKTPTKQKVTKGDSYACEVCGLAVTVDEVCGCIETSHIICCSKPMKAKKARAKCSTK